MTLADPPPAAYLLTGVVGPAVVALIGVLAARSRQGGRWRTFLVPRAGRRGPGPGPGVAGALAAGHRVLVTCGCFGEDEAGVDAFTRAARLDLLVQTVELAAFAAVVGAAMLGRPPLSAGPAREPREPSRI